MKELEAVQAAKAPGDGGSGAAILSAPPFPAVPSAWRKCRHRSSVLALDPLREPAAGAFPAVRRYFHYGSPCVAPRKP